MGRFSQRSGWPAPKMNYFVLGLFLGKSWWRSILKRFSQRFGWPAPTMNQICSWAVRSQDLIKGWTWYPKARLNGIKIKPSKSGWCMFGSKEASPWQRLSFDFGISERVSMQEMASGVDTGWHRLTPVDTALWNARIWCPLGVQRSGHPGDKALNAQGTSDSNGSGVNLWVNLGGVALLSLHCETHASDVPWAFSAQGHPGDNSETSRGHQLRMFLEWILRWMLKWILVRTVLD